MAIKVYRSSLLNNNVPIGGSGIQALVQAFSPGNRMLLKRVQIMFNSYDTITNSFDNPLIERLNYLNLEIYPAVGRVSISMNNTATKGQYYNSESMLFVLPGVYDLDLEFNERINGSLYTYNYAADNARAHRVDIYFTVNETPISQ